MTANPSGYSGTPLPAKLGLKPGQRTLLAGVPAIVESSLGGALASTTRLARTGAFDFALAFVDSRAALAKTLDRHARVDLRHIRVRSAGVTAPQAGEHFGRQPCVVASGGRKVALEMLAANLRQLVGFFPRNAAELQ